MTLLDQMIEEAKKAYEEAKAKYTDLVKLRREIQNGLCYPDKRDDVPKEQ